MIEEFPVVMMAGCWDDRRISCGDDGRVLG